MKKNGLPSKREIKEELAKIYESSTGNVPDMTKLEHASRQPVTRILSILFGVLVIISLAVWGAFILFSGGLFPEEKTLEATIEGPKAAVSGELVSYRLRYENAGSVPIASLQLELHLPDSFLTLSTIPEATEQNRWNLGTLESGSDGSITLNGMYLAEVPSEPRLQSVFTYKPANFNSDFQTIETTTTTIESSVLEVDVNGPERVLSGEEVTYELTLNHTGKESLFNIEMEPLLPEGFTISETKPELPPEKNAWDVAQLNPGEEQTMSYTGTYASDVEGEQFSGGRVYLLHEGRRLPQTQEQTTTNVVGGALSTHLIINGSDTGITSRPGETLRGSIDYTNREQEPLGDLSFALRVESDNGIPIDWSDADLGGGTRDGNTIRWNSASRSELARIEGGGQGIIDFTLPIASTVTRDADTFSVTTTSTVGTIGDMQADRSTQSSPIAIQLNSDTSLFATTHHLMDGGDRVGSGSIPPEAGSTTTLRGLFTLQNALHPLAPVEISTTLPSNVQWTDDANTDIGTITYNPTTRQLSWRIDRLPTSITEPEAWFNLAASPTEGAIGSFMHLTNTITVEATDDTTGNNLNFSIDPLTSELSDAGETDASGVVIEGEDL